MANIKGIIEARRVFAALPEIHRDIINDVHEVTAREMVRQARASVPRRTGLLARSINYSLDKRRGIAKVGIERGMAHYGHFVEFGTIYQPAHPFMQPAAERQRGLLEGRFLAAGRRLEQAASAIGGRFL